MTTPHVSPSRSATCLVAVVVCAAVGWSRGLTHIAVGSEVISAIPGNAQPPLTPGMVVETIEAGTRGPAPAPHHRHPEHCAGGQCVAGRCAHGGCRHGSCEVPGCPAHCPVRPATFGFYGTQWRSWPGQKVVQAVHTEPAAPVMPPKSEVPTADEESPVPGFELPATGAAADVPEPMDLESTDAESTPRSPLQAEPAPLPEPDAAPEAAPPRAPAEDNLFDEAALRRRCQERLAMLGHAAAQQERVRLEALRQHAQRLVRQAPPGGSAVAIKPPVVDPLGASNAGPESLVRPASDDRVPSTLKQAVHQEPSERGLRAAGTPPLGNPLRARMPLP